MVNRWIRAKLSRLSINTQLSLWLLLLGVGLGLVALLLWIDSGEQAARLAQREIDMALNASSSDLTEQSGDLATLGRWLVREPSLATMILERDKTSLTRLVEPLTKTASTSTITVADHNGIVLARVSPGQEVTAGDDILNLPGVSEGLAGQESSGMTSVPTGGLRQDLVLPVLAAEGKLPIGVLILSLPYDENFAARMSGKVEHDVAIAYEARIIASTLTDSEGRPWANQIAPAQLRQAEFDNSINYMFLETDESRYLFRFVRLPVPGSTRPLLYGVGIPSSFIENAQRSLFRTAGLGLLAIGFGIALLGLLSVRLIVRPVQKLLASTRTMASGNLLDAIALPRRDEFGELAQNLDLVRLNVNRSLQSALLERDRNAAIVQSMGIATVVTDHNSRILGVNPAAEMLLARSQSHLIGQSLYDFFIVTARNDHIMVPMWEAGSVGVGGDHSPVVRGRFLLRERPQTTVDVISTRVQVESEPGGYVHLLQDVTPQEQISLAKDEFLLNAAHELRAPLSSLRTSIELLLEDYSTMSKGNLGLMLRHLQKSSLRFQSLVENLIEIDSIKAGRFRVRPVPTALDEIILDAVDQTAPLLKARGQMIEVKQEGATGLRVMADRRRILQVIINLLNNASKYGPEDEPIMLSTCHGGGLAFVGVTDRGAGIPPEEQDNIFKRFYRSKQAENQGSGIGLGLALSREIVEAHGGTIRLTSAPGMGTTFWFDLREIAEPDPISSRQIAISIPSSKN